MRSHFAAAAALTVALFGGAARADDVLHLGAATLDRPTVATLGVRWALTGDDNFNAKVAVQYRPAGTTAWRDGLPLYRVHAELVTAGAATPEFAGSIFDLAPDTSYEIQLVAYDPDGGDQTTMLTAKTRPVPAADPTNPRAVQAATAAALQSALDDAQPGDVITLAAGTYDGEFTLNGSGAAANPIVIRGVDRDTVILDGGNVGGNVLAIEGSFTHVEDLTLYPAAYPRPRNEAPAKTQGLRLPRRRRVDVATPALHRRVASGAQTTVHGRVEAPARSLLVWRSWRC